MGCLRMAYSKSGRGWAVQQQIGRKQNSKSGRKHGDGSKRQNSRSGREDRAESRKQSSKGRGLEWLLLGGAGKICGTTAKKVGPS